MDHAAAERELDQLDADAKATDHETARIKASIAERASWRHARGIELLHTPWFRVRLTIWTRQ